MTPALRGSGRTVVEETAEQTANPTCIVHYEHPERPGEAWCGADVQGTVTKAGIGCVVCVDLWNDFLRRWL